MAILNYTTKVEAQVTISEIQTILISHGVRKISVDYDEIGHPMALTFSCPFKGENLFFMLPCKSEKVHKVLLSQTNDKRYNSKEQSLRVAWRIIKTWVDAQMAFLETEMVDIAEIFLPYSITKSGSTLYEAIKQDHSQFLIG